MTTLRRTETAGQPPVAIRYGVDIVVRRFPIIGTVYRAQLVKFIFGSWEDASPRSRWTRRRSKAEAAGHKMLDALHPVAKESRVALPSR